MKIYIFLMMCGGIWLNVMGGWTGEVLASNSLIRLSVDSGRLTGQLTQVTLRAVLEQLQDQLNIDFVASDTELEKVISISLQKELLPEALAKILAPWDYAFSLDAAGNIKTLYVMAKWVSESSLADVGAKDEEIERHNQKGREIHRDGRSGNESSLWHEDRFHKEASLLDRPIIKERKGTNEKAFTPVAVQRVIRPPAPGTTMPILPPKRKDMPIIPGASSQTMEIVPPTAYPPMNIQPVPEHVKQEMLLTVKP